MAQQTISTRKIRFPANVLGVFFVILAALAATTRRNDLAAETDHKLASVTSDRAQAISNEFEKGTTIALLLSRNTAFSEYSEAHSSNRTTALVGAEISRAQLNRVRSEESLQYLESLYAGGVGEACIYNGLGIELVQVVGGRVTRGKQLSKTENEKPFFQPTFSLRSGEVSLSQPYLSEDTNQWVVSQSTLLPFVHASKAFMHFEVSLERFANRLRFPSDGPGLTIQLVNRTTGEVIVDGDGGIFASATEGDFSKVRDRDSYLWLTNRKNPTGITTHNGRRLSIGEVSRGANNENDWLVVTSIPTADSPFSALWGFPIWLALFGIAALLGGWFASRVYLSYLQHAANSDALTGLANRRHLAETLSEIRPAADIYAAVVVDLDRFKEVNDKFGHSTGDSLLVAVSERLIDHLPSTDLVCRLGGDEFAIILKSKHTEQQLVAQARALHDHLILPYVIDGLRIDLEASVGVAIGSPILLSGPELLQRADQAMHSAKKLHNGIEVFQIGQESACQQQLMLLGELRTAIGEHQLVVFFQPKISFDNGEIHSMEALVRWQHPSRGLLPPGAFIEFAEQTSLIRPLTLEVIDLTLKQIKAWSGIGEDVKVAVNISTRSLLDDELIPGLQRLLAHHHCEPSSLQLEITESTLMHDPARALKLLARIHDLGIEISIDDFGTGYSSLAHLTDLKAQELKIDRAFVSRMTTDPASAAVVQSIIALGHNLGMRVVAEGVEDHATARQLHRAGCDIGQGFLWSKPVPASAAFDARVDCADNFSLIVA